mmetsp:Transcript_143/g.202  ORF Transcript_143/g.202 Transcript_143/m.202 type:complete len:2064 (-) Transcript_143:174-6365(-)
MTTGTGDTPINTPTPTTTTSTNINSEQDEETGSGNVKNGVQIDSATSNLMAEKVENEEHGDKLKSRKTRKGTFLPPPPTFDPSAFMVIGNTDAISSSVNDSSRDDRNEISKRASHASSLPDPPAPLPFVRSAGKINASTSSGSIQTPPPVPLVRSKATITPKKKKRNDEDEIEEQDVIDNSNVTTSTDSNVTNPAMPLVRLNEPEPITINIENAKDAPKSTNNLTAHKTKFTSTSTGNDHHQLDSNQTNYDKSKFHQISEVLPTLDSAPNSGSFQFQSIIPKNDNEPVNQSYTLNSSVTSPTKADTIVKLPSLASKNDLSQNHTNVNAEQEKHNPKCPQQHEQKYDPQKHEQKHDQQQHDHQEPNNKERMKQKTSVMAAPPLTLLSQTQTHIPVLLLSTPNARYLASKNNLTLAQMFTSMANSLSSHSSKSSSLGRLAPFRSVGKSIVLNWEFIRLIFIDADDLLQPALKRRTNLLNQIISLHHQNDNTSQENELKKEIQQLTNDKSNSGEYDESLLRHASDTWDEDASMPNHIPTLSELEHKIHDLRSHSQNKTTSDDLPETGGNKSKNKLHMHDNADAAFALTSPPHSPWLLRIRSALDGSTDHLPHDMLHCPPLCLIVTSSSEGLDFNINQTQGTSKSSLNAIDCLAELSNHHHLPSPYQCGLYDNEAMRREYLILHDEIDGPPDFDEAETLKEMQSRFGPGCCAVLRINSINYSQKDTIESFNEEEEDQTWDNFLPHSLNLVGMAGKQVAKDNKLFLRGMCLSMQDKNVMRRYMAQMITLSLLPCIERRISHLNVTVSNAKKGVKNVLKSFWRKPKDSGSNYSGGSMHGPGNSRHGRNNSKHGNNAVEPVSLDGNARCCNLGDVRYSYDTIESQTRLLADTLFLVRDYESALSMYKLVKDDYRQDKSLLHHASVYEMMALCLHLLDPRGLRNGHEVIRNIETALFLYTRAAEDPSLSGGGNINPAPSSSRSTTASSATRCATRLCLVLSSTRTLCNRRDAEVADLLASASSCETPLGAAALLEQSSGHYYRAGMYRKFAFHMLMAGHMFRSAKMNEHALRCFIAASHIYDGELIDKRSWDQLKNHITSALAAQVHAMGRMALGLCLYSRLIGSSGGQVSVRSQKKFLDHLLEICRQNQADSFNGAKHCQGLLSDSFEDYNSKKEKQFNSEKMSTKLPFAERILELSSIDLPKVFHSTISVEVEDSPTSPVPVDDEYHFHTFGNSTISSETVWKDMMCSVQAELRVHERQQKAGLSSSIDQTIQQIIQETDLEKENASFLARAAKKKSSHYVDSPTSRARSEPISISFDVANPLGIQIPIKDMQLIARLRCVESGRIYSSEEPIKLSKEMTNDSSFDQNKIWKFDSSRDTFTLPNFLCILPKNTSYSTGSSQEQLSAYNEYSSGLRSSIEKSKVDNPFPSFVVSKIDLNLEPNTTVNVKLRLCPLIKGDLEILGMRCKIFNDVWTSQCFKVKGPLLQNTASNRSTRARGESFLLKSKIEQDMPNLSVDAIPSDSNAYKRGIMLQGQVSDWVLRVSNRGTAPAHNVILKTNVPWVNILRSDESVSSSVSHCIGPSGTLMRLPVENEKNDDGFSFLSPGSTVNVPIQVRSSGGGKQQFYMLFRYESIMEDSEKKSSDRSNSEAFSSTSVNTIRWLKKTMTVSVSPSLTVTASITPYFWRHRDHLLSVEISNYRSDSGNLDIKLDKICVAGKYYQVKPLGVLYEDDISHTEEKVDHSNDLGSNADSESLSIHWQEQVTLHYIVCPVSVEEDPCYTLSVCNVLNKMNAKSVAKISHIREEDKASPITDYLCLEHAHEYFIERVMEHQKAVTCMQIEKEKEGDHPRSIAQIRRSKNQEIVCQIETGKNSDDIPPEASNDLYPDVGIVSQNRMTKYYHPTSMLALCPQTKGGSKINIICTWAASVNSDKLMVLKGQHHLRQLTIRPELKSLGCPIAMTVRYESEAFHNFSETPLHVHFEILLRNRLIFASVEFEFSLIEQHDFEFVGSECFEHTLGPGEELILPVEAILFSSGVYDLQKVKLSVCKDGKKTLHTFPFQWILKANSR